MKSQSPEFFVIDYNIYIRSETSVIEIDVEIIDIDIVEGGRVHKSVSGERRRWEGGLYLGMGLGMGMGVQHQRLLGLGWEGIDGRFGAFSRVVGAWGVP